MKKERLLYLDYIRAFSTVLIILTHYNALFLYLPETYTGNGIILTAYVNGLYIGDWGVSLFLIISGAALMYTYQNDFDLRTFYKKRLLTIYPLYWLTYVIVMSYMFIKYKTINPSGATPWKIILSLIGMDAYLGTITETYLCIGEWFLGMIILIYLLFPIIFYMMKRCEVLLWILLLGVMGWFVLFNFLPMSPATIVFVRLPEFCFGMTFIKHKEWIMAKQKLFLGFAVLLLLMDRYYRPYISISVRTAYMGIIAFLGFVYISKYLYKVKIINKISAWICKYSYIIFLVHHRIIWETTGKWDMANISKFQSLLLFFICLELIGICAVLIKQLFDNMRVFFSNI